MPLIGMPILSASVSISPRRDDLADRLLHVGELIGAFLDPGADLGADMHQDRTGIDRGKEVPPEIRHQQERNPDQAEESDHENRPSRHRQRQQVVVAAAQALEARLESPLEPDQRVARRRRPLAFGMVDVRLQQVFGHRRHQGARQQERPDHREDHGQRHRHEQKARHALQEEHRHEHDADAQQRDEGRRHDLVGAVQDRGLDVLALLQMPVDVLDRDRGVVDENADRQRQAAERHDVEGFSDRRQHHDGAEHRERYRHRDDDGRAPASEEQQDHHAGQQRGDDAFNGDAGDRAADEHRLIADEADLQRIGQRVLDVDDLLLDAGDDIQRRDRAGLQHHHQHRTVAIDVHDIGLRRIAVAHAGDVADIDHGAVDGLDRQIAEFFHPQRRIVELDDVFETADLLGADRGNQVLRGERVGDILPGQAAGLQRLRIEIDLDLALLAAERIGDRGARHRHQRRAQLVDADIGEVLFGEAFARQRDLDDRHGGGAVVEDQRRRRPGRHLPDHGLRNRGDLGVGDADIDIRLEEDLDDADAVVGVRHDVFDVVDRRRQRALERRDHAPGHLVRRQAGIVPDHADHGDPDIRKNVGRGAQRGERPDDQEKQREHDESIRPAQRYTDQ